MKADADWMQLALQEARKGLGKTSPNPAVGAVIVKDGQLLSKGWHRRAGRPHAEIEAIRALPDPAAARGATIFITLEPCSTHGLTPPCVEAILAHGFVRVVVGTTDPNPAHAGRGLEILRRAGVEVVSGVLEDECRRLNEAFNHWIVTRMPLVIAKCAMSLDGRITRPPGESQWLTSAPARKRAHQIRAQVDAILVGAETVRRDNPQLTIRGLGPRATRRQPWRVVVSRSGNLPASSNLFTDEWKERTLVFDDLDTALEELGQRQATSVLIEGGGEILGAAFDKKLVDRVAFFYAPMLVGGDKPAVAGLGVESNESAIQLEQVSYEKLGPDLFCQASVRY
ncbi:MAG: bifunctional diaminohydroxyphosphoribosylaminopyrimidine deaminase/5-amino-6-(5-phosphoribosylamino)uracil reductase RibD [Chthoniobacterales bacterium]